MLRRVSNLQEKLGTLRASVVGGLETANSSFDTMRAASAQLRSMVELDAEEFKTLLSPVDIQSIKDKAKEQDEKVNNSAEYKSVLEAHVNYTGRVSTLTNDMDSLSQRLSGLHVEAESLEQFRNALIQGIKETLTDYYESNNAEAESEVAKAKQSSPSGQVIPPNSPLAKQVAELAQRPFKQLNEKIALANKKLNVNLTCQLDGGLQFNDELDKLSLSSLIKYANEFIWQTNRSGTEYLKRFNQRFTAISKTYEKLLSCTWYTSLKDGYYYCLEMIDKTVENNFNNRVSQEETLVKQAELQSQQLDNVVALIAREKTKLDTVKEELLAEARAIKLDNEKILGQAQNVLAKIKRDTETLKNANTELLKLIEQDEINVVVVREKIEAVEKARRAIKAFPSFLRTFREENINPKIEIPLFDEINKGLESADLECRAILLNSKDFLKSASKKVADAEANVQLDAVKQQPEVVRKSSLAEVAKQPKPNAESNEALIDELLAVLLNVLSDTNIKTFWKDKISLAGKISAFCGSKIDINGNKYAVPRGICKARKTLDRLTQNATAPQKAEIVESACRAMKERYDMDKVHRRQRVTDTLYKEIMGFFNENKFVVKAGQLTSFKNTLKTDAYLKVLANVADKPVKSRSASVVNE